MFIYCHIDNEKLKKIEKRRKFKKKNRWIESRTSFHFMTFYFTTCHSYLMLHGEMLFSRLYPRIKNGWFIGNPNQHSRAHSRGIWARYSRDEGATRQVNQVDWGTYWSYIRKHLWIPLFSTQPILPSLIYQRYPGHESLIPVRGNVPPRVHHPNWQPHAPTPAISPAFRKAS